MSSQPMSEFDIYTPPAYDTDQVVRPDTQNVPDRPPTPAAGGPPDPEPRKAIVTHEKTPNLATLVERGEINPEEITSARVLENFLQSENLTRVVDYRTRRRPDGTTERRAARSELTEEGRKKISEYSKDLAAGTLADMLQDYQSLSRAEDEQGHVLRLLSAYEAMRRSMRSAVETQIRYRVQDTLKHYDKYWYDQFMQHINDSASRRAKGEHAPSTTQIYVEMAQQLTQMGITPDSPTLADELKQTSKDRLHTPSAAKSLGTKIFNAVGALGGFATTINPTIPAATPRIEMTTPHTIQTSDVPSAAINSARDNSVTINRKALRSQLKQTNQPVQQTTNEAPTPAAIATPEPIATPEAAIQQSEPFVLGFGDKKIRLIQTEGEPTSGPMTLVIPQMEISATFKGRMFIPGDALSPIESEYGEYATISNHAGKQGDTEVQFHNLYSRISQDTIDSLSATRPDKGYIQMKDGSLWGKNIGEYFREKLEGPPTNAEPQLTTAEIEANLAAAYGAEGTLRAADGTELSFNYYPVKLSVDETTYYYANVNKESSILRKLIQEKHPDIPMPDVGWNDYLFLTHCGLGATDEPPGDMAGRDNTSKVLYVHLLVFKP